jgi:hypothetical protein
MTVKFDQLVGNVMHLDQLGAGKAVAFVVLRAATAERRAKPGPSPPTHKAAAQSRRMSPKQTEKRHHVAQFSPTHDDEQMIIECCFHFGREGCSSDIPLTFHSWASHTPLDRGRIEDQSAHMHKVPGYDKKCLLEVEAEKAISRLG